MFLTWLSDEMGKAWRRRASTTSLGGGLREAGALADEAGPHGAGGLLTIYGTFTNLSTPAFLMVENVGIPSTSSVARG